MDTKKWDARFALLVLMVCWMWAWWPQPVAHAANGETANITAYSVPGAYMYDNQGPTPFRTDIAAAEPTQASATAGVRTFRPNGRTTLSLQAEFVQAAGTCTVTLFYFSGIGTARNHIWTKDIQFTAGTKRTPGGRFTDCAIADTLGAKEVDVHITALGGGEVDLDVRVGSY